ncbi:MAG: eCIS core domain-containing protein [Flavobacteriales bacterium]
MKASENTSPQPIHTASAAIKTESAASDGHEAPVVQRRANNTGLPDNLKTGIENLSGYALDDVKVHYNSAQPAQLQAHAYAQGSDIHVAPGQEKHLPHEAWHVVQQKQGRVKATTQLKGQTPVNDDAGLEKEADVMGVKALSATPDSTMPLSLKSVSAERTVQKKGFTGGGPTSEETAVSIIKSKIGVAAGKQKLPDTDGISSATDRASALTALISKDTVGDEARLKSNGNLSKTTGMARDEAFILMGADPKKFYDAGHLIGDQLLKKLGKTYSFVMKNLAPQTAGFNAPSYSELMENPIKAQAAKGKTIEMNVQLTYPQNYTVSLEHIIKRGIVSVAKDHGNNTVDIKDGKKKLDKNMQLSFPRRIPKKWQLNAKEVSKTPKTLAKFEKDKSDKAFVNMVDDSAKLKDNLALNRPYNFYIHGIDKKNVSHGVEDKGDKWGFKEVSQRILEARQWRPPLNTEINKEELKGPLRLYFPDVVDDNSLNTYFGTVDQKGFDILEHIGREFLQVMGETFGVKIPDNAFDSFKDEIGKKLDEAQIAYSKGDKESLNTLLTEAEEKLAEFKTKAEEYMEAAKESSVIVGKSLEATQQMYSEVSTLLLTSGLSSVPTELLSESMGLSMKLLNVSSLIKENKLEDALNVLKEVISGANGIKEEILELIEEKKRNDEEISIEDETDNEDDTSDSALSLNLNLVQNTPSLLPVPGTTSNPELKRKRTKSVIKNSDSQEDKKQKLDLDAIDDDNTN